jgi:hypothetical protein
MACMIFSPDGNDIPGAPGYKRTAGEWMKHESVDVLQKKFTNVTHWIIHQSLRTKQVLGHSNRHYN